MTNELSNNTTQLHTCICYLDLSKSEWIPWGENFGPEFYIADGWIIHTITHYITQGTDGGDHFRAITMVKQNES